MCEEKKIDWTAIISTVFTTIIITIAKILIESSKDQK
jgi:hypothetical protein